MVSDVIPRPRNNSKRRKCVLRGRYVSQGHISVINSILSLVCGALTSIELFLNIQKKMETDLVSHKDYYRLAIDIYSPERSARKVDGKTFLDQKFSEYEKRIESSNIVDNDYLFDTLASSYPIMMNSGQNNEEIGRTYQNTLVGTSNSYHQTKLAKLSYRKEQTAMHFYTFSPLLRSETPKGLAPSPGLCDYI